MEIKSLDFGVADFWAKQTLGGWGRLGPVRIIHLLIPNEIFQISP